LSIDSQPLAKRFLGFNCHVDAMRLAANEATVKDLVGKEVVVPDLTAFLCAFSAGFAGVTLSHASLLDNGSQLILERKDAGIPVCEIHKDVVLGKEAIHDIMSALVTHGKSI
jgi:hypothetical protein